MRITAITSCYIGPKISPEQFISEHFFFVSDKGAMHGYDGNKNWLVQKRLHEAYFLMDKKGSKASDVYLEVGFEDLSHFSFAFKKLFGFTPTQLPDRKKKIG